MQCVRYRSRKLVRNLPTFVRAKFPLELCTKDHLGLILAEKGDLFLLERAGSPRTQAEDLGGLFIKKADPRWIPLQKVKDVSVLMWNS